MPALSHKSDQSDNKITLRKIEISAAMNRCGWTDSDRSRYLKIAGVDRECLDECTPDEISTIYFRMVGSRLIGRTKAGGDDG